MQVSKQDINYHLPDKCCGKCDHAYNNTYGDACCQLLECTDTIDFGGVCCMYKHNETVVKEDIEVPELVVEEEEKGDCNDCIHSFFDGEHQPRCGADNELIISIGTCNAWEKTNG